MELGASHSGADLGAKIYGAELGARVAGAEPLTGLLPVPRTSAPVTVAPSSAPLTLAPSEGSISGILSARGLFERNFRKKDQKVKNSVAQPAYCRIRTGGDVTPEKSRQDDRVPVWNATRV